MFEKLKVLWSSLQLWEKVFALLFLLVVIWGMLLLTPVLTGGFAASLNREKVEGLRNHPAIQAQITALMRQGMPKASVDRQLTGMASEQTALCAAQREKSVLWGLAALLLVGLAILILLCKKDLPKNQRNFLLGAIITVMLVQGFSMAVRYIEPDPRDLSCQEGIKKLMKLDKLYRVFALDKAFYNPWISEYFPLYDIPCVNVPADSRPSVWRKLFFYDPKFSLDRSLLYANVRYVLASPEELDALGIPLKKIGNFSFQGRRQAIGELNKTLPRFYAPQSMVSIPDLDKAQAFMNDRKVDPLAVGVLHSEKSFPRGEGTNVVSLVNFSPEKVELKADFAFPGCAILACEPLSGWYALVDGEKKAVERCNLMQQAVAVPEGKHDVCFVYDKRDLSSVICDFMHVVFLPIFAVITLAALFLKKKHAE